MVSVTVVPVPLLVPRLVTGPGGPEELEAARLEDAPAALEDTTAADDDTPAVEVAALEVAALEVAALEVAAPEVAAPEVAALEVAALDPGDDVAVAEEPMGMDVAPVAEEALPAEVAAEVWPPPEDPLRELVAWDDVTAPPPEDPLAVELTQ